MAKRKKQKINPAVTIISCVLALAIGALAGFAASTFLGNEKYIIPDAVAANNEVTAGNIKVEEFKDKELSIHFLELGNKYTGDCTFIKVGNTEILIDAGSRADSVDDIYDYISPYISDGKLEYVIVTHAHQDHYAGFATGEKTDSLFDKLNVGTVVTFAKTNQKDSSTLYKNFKRELEETKEKNGTKVYSVGTLVAENNAVYTLGDGIELEFLYQKYYDEKASTENDYSVCCMITQKTDGEDNRYLFTGDLEEDGEESLVEKNKGKLGKVKLFKAGHHGSKTSSSKALLDVIDPEIVCVCACAGSPEYTKNNDNQFPTQAFIDRVFPHTENVYVTSLCVDYNKGEFTSMNGYIVVYTEADKVVKVKCSNNATKLKDTEWFKANRKLPAAA